MTSLIDLASSGSRGDERRQRGDGRAAREAEREAIARAAAGDTGALRALVCELTPVVQTRAARVLARAGGPLRGSALRHDVADLTQDVLASLFANGAHVLREWRPEAGLSLRGFVGLVAEREAISRVRSRRRSPLTQAPTDDRTLERAAGHAGDEEGAIISRDTLVGVVRGLERSLSPLGMRVFHALFVEESSVEATSVALSLSVDAIYQWRSRIRRAAREVAGEAEH